MFRPIYRMRRVIPKDILEIGLKEGFRVQSSWHLIKQFLLFTFSRFPFLLRFAEHPLLQSYIARGLNGIYTGGETFEAARQVVEDLRLNKNTLTILDETIEEVHDSAQLDQNLRDKLKFLSRTAEEYPEVMFVPIKCTSLIAPQALEALTALLLRRRFSCWEEVLDITKSLSERECELYEEGYARLRALCQHAQALSPPRLSLLLDAEISSRQLAVEFLFIQLARQFNLLPPMLKRRRLRQEREMDSLFVPLLYNTCQSYLKRSHHALLRDVAFCQRHKLAYGVKLVRGAYLNQETQQQRNSNSGDNTNNNIMSNTNRNTNDSTNSYGSDCVVYATKEETDRSYENNLFFLLNYLSQYYVLRDLASMPPSPYSSPVHVIVATHNRESIEQAVRFVQAYLYELNWCNEGRERKTREMLCYHLHFAQIYGMVNHLTYQLAYSGYYAHKLVLYGKEERLFPWLLRRVRENQDVLGGVQREQGEVRREVKMRLIPWLKFYYALKREPVDYSQFTRNLNKDAQEEAQRREEKSHKYKDHCCS